MKKPFILKPYFYKNININDFINIHLNYINKLTVNKQESLLDLYIEYPNIMEDDIEENTIMNYDIINIIFVDNKMLFHDPDIKSYSSMKNNKDFPIIGIHESVIHKKTFLYKDINFTDFINQNINYINTLIDSKKQRLFDLYLEYPNIMEDDNLRKILL